MSEEGAAEQSGRRHSIAALAHHIFVLPSGRCPGRRTKTPMPDFGPLVTLNDPAFIHPSVQIYGRVAVDAGASLWPNTVVRAENYEVRIGASTNIQDFTMIHVGSSTGTFIGAHCSITHHCTIHGCTIGDNSLIGINATIMDGAIIGDNCIVAGGAFVKGGTVVPDNSIVMASPAKSCARRTTGSPIASTPGSTNTTDAPTPAANTGPGTATHSWPRQGKKWSPCRANSRRSRPGARRDPGICAQRRGRRSRAGIGLP